MGRHGMIVFIPPRIETQVGDLFYYGIEYKKL